MADVKKESGKFPTHRPALFNSDSPLRFGFGWNWEIP